jgi:hypothetical protein
MIQEIRVIITSLEVMEAYDPEAIIIAKLKASGVPMVEGSRAPERGRLMVQPDLFNDSMTYVWSSV